MQRFITGPQIATSVMMLRRQNRQTSYLVVEGRTDLTCYRWLIDESKCQPIVAASKGNVIDCMKILNKKKVSGALGIVDSDFWNMENKTSASNVLRTDTHDVETLITKSRALDKVLSVYGKKPCPVQNPWEIIINAAKPLGYLRWISHKHNLNLKFKNLTYSDFIDEETLHVDLDAMVRAVIRNTWNCTISYTSLIAMLNAELGIPHDLWQICNGHDVVAILSIGLSQFLGSFGGPANPQSVSNWLILAYESKDFCQTNLYRSITHWEKSNKPFIVIADHYRRKTFRRLKAPSHIIVPQKHAKQPLGGA